MLFRVTDEHGPSGKRLKLDNSNIAQLAASAQSHDQNRYDENGMDSQLGPRRCWKSVVTIKQDVGLLSKSKMLQISVAFHTASAVVAPVPARRR